MQTLLLSLEFIISLGLIICILLHSPKGDGLGAIGGRAKLFSSQKGMEAGLTRFTIILAILFFLITGILGVFF